METVFERENEMRDVLRRLEAGEDLNKFSPHDKRILKDCYDAGYFEGTVPIEMISERIVFENRFTPRLTYAGLQFLESVESSAKDLEESGAEDYQEQKNGIQECLQFGIHFMKRFWALLGGIAVLVTLFGWSTIRKAIAFLLSFFR